MLEGMPSEKLMFKFSFLSIKYDAYVNYGQDVVIVKETSVAHSLIIFTVRKKF
jgi:hypothetical protein